MENPYSAPKSDMSESFTAKITSMFSPNQITLGSFIGGPLASVYFLYQNFSALNQVENAQKTLFWGLSLCFIFICLLPFIPESVPNSVIPIAYCLFARLMAEKHQCSKQQIIENDLFEFQSNWRVLIITVSALLLLMVLIIPIMFAVEMITA